MNINKKIALAVAGILSFAGFTAVSAHATPSIAYTTMYDNVNGYQVVNGIATLTITTDTSTVNSVYLSGVGSIVAASAGSNDTVTIAPFASVSGGVINSFQVTNGSAGAGHVTVSLSSATVGSSTLSITPINQSTGVPGAVVSSTVTWEAQGQVGINAANSSLYLVPAGTACATVGTSKASDTANIAADTSVTSSYSTSQSVKACFIARDSNNNLVNVTSTSSIYGGLGGGSTVGSVTSNGSVTVGTPVVSGNAQVTAVLTDSWGNVIQLSTPLTVYGVMTSLSLSNGTYAAQFGGKDSGTGSTVNTATSALGVLSLVAKDANGSQIDIVSTALTTPLITVQSSANTTVPSIGQSTSLGATTSFGTDHLAAANTTYGISGNEVFVDCAHSVKAEKLTITVSATNPTTSAVVTSNPVTFYCSNVPASNAGIVVSSAETVTASAVAPVTATVTDANGFPVPDGTSVSFASSSNSTIAPSTSATLDGVAGTSATTKVNLIAGSASGQSTVTAIAGNYTGSTVVNIGNGVSASAQSTLATDAATAATDAANAAQQAAQNATQAASDALAAVQALQAQVVKLFGQLKAQLTSIQKLFK